MKNVLSFGVFDGLHPGHKFFLKKAKTYGDILVVSLARDEIVFKLKGYNTKFNFEERKKALIESGLVDEIIEGDYEIGTFRSVSLAHPDIVCLGYDQTKLENELQIWMKKYVIEIPTIFIESFHPEKYKSSLLK